MIITGMKEFEEVCKDKLVEWYNARATSNKLPKINKENTFVVWCCKTLQNYKALLSTDVSGDGIYAEYTYNGDKTELYELDYIHINEAKKFEKIVNNINSFVNMKRRLFINVFYRDRYLSR